MGDSCHVGTKFTSSCRLEAKVLEGARLGHLGPCGMGNLGPSRTEKEAMTYLVIHPT